MPTPALPPDQLAVVVLTGMAVIVGAARLVGGLAVRLRQPRVVGEILAGVLLGPSLLGWVAAGVPAPAFLHAETSLAGSGVDPSLATALFPAPARSVLAVVGQLALVLFLFLAGSRFDATLLRGRVRSAVVVALGTVVAPVLATLALGGALASTRLTAGFGTANAPSTLAFSLFLGAMLATTAFPVAIRILDERGLARTDAGALAIGTAAVATVAMFLVVGLAGGVATGAPATSHLVRLGGLAAFVVLLLGVVRPVLGRLGFGRPGADPAGLVAGGVALALVAAVATDRIGVSPYVGAFLVGAALPRREAVAERLAPALGPLTNGVLLPVFLAVAGLQADLRLLDVGLLVPLVVVLVVAVATKYGVGVVLARACRVPVGDARLLGALANCRGLLVLVVGTAGLEAGVVTTDLHTVGTVVALVTTAMTGPLVDRSRRTPDDAPAEHPHPCEPAPASTPGRGRLPTERSGPVGPGGPGGVATIGGVRPLVPSPPLYGEDHARGDLPGTAPRS